MEQKLLGSIFETFTIMDKHRVIVLDRDCSEEINRGDIIDIVFKSGNKTTIQTLDCLSEKGPKMGVEADKVVSLRVNNIDFPAYDEVIGAQIFLNKKAG